MFEILLNSEYLLFLETNLQFFDLFCKVFRYLFNLTLDIVMETSSLAPKQYNWCFKGVSENIVAFFVVIYVVVIE